MARLSFSAVTSTLPSALENSTAPSRTVSTASRLDGAAAGTVLVLPLASACSFTPNSVPLTRAVATGVTTANRTGFRSFCTFDHISPVSSFTSDGRADFGFWILDFGLAISRTVLKLRRRVVPSLKRTSA